VGQMLDLFVEAGWTEALVLTFRLDLLSYHAHLHCYVMIDLEASFFCDSQERYPTGHNRHCWIIYLSDGLIVRVRLPRLGLGAELVEDNR
jgi:hypothetical protein